MARSTDKILEQFLGLFIVAPFIGVVVVVWLLFKFLVKLFSEDTQYSSTKRSSLSRNSFIGAFHAAGLQREFVNHTIIYILFNGIVIGGLIGAPFGAGAALIAGAIVSAVLFIFIGSYLFILIANTINAIAISIGGIVALLDPELAIHPLVVIFGAIGSWAILYSILWFGNNYFTYLSGYLEKEDELLYKE